MGCESGIYAAPVEPDGTSILLFLTSLLMEMSFNIVTEFRRILNYRHPTSLAALTTSGHKTFNRFVVHADSAIMTYSLDILARLALDKSHLHSLDASIERVGQNDGSIVFCKHIHLDERALCSYMFHGFQV